MPDSGQIVEGITWHFMAGCPELTAPQLAEHQQGGSCAACRIVISDSHVAQFGTDEPLGWDDEPVPVLAAEAVSAK